MALKDHQEKRSLSTLVNKFSHNSFKTTPTILQVIPALGNGGVEIETLEMAKAILAAGGRALIAANLSNKDNLWSTLPPEVQLINLPLNTKNPFKIVKNAALLKELIQ